MPDVGVADSHMPDVGVAGSHMPDVGVAGSHAICMMCHGNVLGDHQNCSVWQVRIHIQDPGQGRDPGQGQDPCQGRNPGQGPPSAPT